MSAARIAVVAASVAALAWWLKGVVIWAAGGLDESALEGPLFVLGLVAILVAAAALGVAAAGGRPTGIKVAAAAGAVVAATALSLLIQTAVGAALPESAGWVQEEAGLWISGALAAALAYARLRAAGETRLSST